MSVMQNTALRDGPDDLASGKALPKCRVVPTPVDYADQVIRAQFDVFGKREVLFEGSEEQCWEYVNANERLYNRRHRHVTLVVVYKDFEVPGRYFV